MAKTIKKGVSKKNLLRAGGFLLVTTVTIVIQMAYWKGTTSPPQQRMLDVERLIHHEQSVVADVYVTTRNRCQWDVAGLENRLTDAVDKFMEKLINLTSIVGWSSEALQTIKPEESELFDNLVNKEYKMIKSWNETVNLLLTVRDVAPEKLLSRLRTLSTILEANNNYINNGHFYACLSEEGTYVNISCIKTMYETYKRNFSTLKLELNNYSKFCDSLLRKVDSVIKLVEEYTFPQQRISVIEAINNSFTAAGITPDLLVAYTKDRVEKYKETILSLTRAIGEQNALADAIFSTYYKRRHQQEDLLKDIHNLVLVTIDFLVYTNRINSPVSADLKKLSLKLFLVYIIQLTRIYKETEIKSRILNLEFTKIIKNLGEHNSIDCCHLYLYSCLTNITMHFSKLHEKAEHLYVSSVAENDYISEEIDNRIKSTIDGFSAAVHNFTSQLIDSYNMQTDDVLSYELMLIQNYYTDTVQNTTARNDEQLFSEMQRKFATIRTIMNDFNKVICGIELQINTTLVEVRSSLIRLKITLAAHCDTYSSTIANHISNVESYKVMDRLDKVNSAVTKESLRNLCARSNDTVVDALHCSDEERTKRVSLMFVIADFYSGVVAGVAKFYRQYLHQIHSILRSELVPILHGIETSIDADKLPAYQYLLCLTGVDIAQSDSRRLESGLQQCRSHLDHGCQIQYF